MTSGRGAQLTGKAAAIADDVAALKSGDRRDISYHLSFLTEAVRQGEPALFAAYVAWAKSMQCARGLPPEDLVEELRLLQAAIRRHVPAEEAAAAVAPIDAAIEAFADFDVEPPAICTPTSPNGQLTLDYLALLLQADRRGAAALIQRAAAEGVPIQRLYLDVFQRSQREIGRLWQLNRLSMAQEHYCTAATQAIMNQLFSQVLEAPRIGRKVMAFCVAGELHEVGLRIVADLFELAGWDYDFLGASTPADSLLAALPAMAPDLIALSATMTYHLEAVEGFIQALRAKPETAHIPVLVGGLPFLIAETLWRRVGADGMAVDGEAAVRRGAELVHGR